MGYHGVDFEATEKLELDEIEEGGRELSPKELVENETEARDERGEKERKREEYQEEEKKQKKILPSPLLNPSLN